MTERTPTIRVSCPQCDQRIRVAVRHAGKRGKCPSDGCNGRFVVPSATESVSPTEQSPKTVPPRPDWLGDNTDSVSELPPQANRIRRSHRRSAVKPSRQRSTRSVAATTPSGRSGTRFWERWSVWSVSLAVLVIGGAVVLFNNSEPTPQSGVGVAVARADTIPAANIEKGKDFDQVLTPFLQKYCMDCHGPGVEIADVDFDRYGKFSDLQSDREFWKKTAAHIRVGSMPPDDHDLFPTRDERDRIVTWLEDNLFHIDCDLVEDPGRVTIRRLNRAEYDNTIRDLFGIEFHASKDFPSDDVGEGFDNNGDVLSLPPLLLEKYLDAAEDITERAILAEKPTSTMTLRKSDTELKGENANLRGDLWSMSSTGSVSGQFPIKRAGKYRIRVSAEADQAGDDPARFEVRVGDRVIDTIATEGRRDRKEYTVETKLAGDSVRLSARFINDYYNPQAKNRNDRDRNLYVHAIEIRGPLDGPPPTYPESHKRIVIATPGENRSVRDAAREIFREFTPKAWRRPVTDGEIEPYIRLVERIAKNGETFERGVQFGVQAILVSPHFLFRVETDPDPDDPERMHHLNDFQLASRLSYFLWSSMPDDELLKLAAENRLHDPTVLAAQTRRMLNDPKAEALVENFAAQWLNLRVLEDFEPDKNLFNEFDDELRQAMIEETKSLFRYVMRDDRSVLELLDADYTFVNARLADHYGLDGVSGEDFQKVSLTDLPRRGVLTHASILTLTSNPDRTSPVKRGVWVLDNILDEHLPEAPPDVPDIAETSEANPNLTFRQQLELHRSSAVCSSCHKTLDPLGFGFENFDAIGRYRETDGGKPIDASGELPSGERFSGSVELVETLSRRREVFYRTLTRRLMVYGLGRGLTDVDRCTVDAIVDDLTRNGDQFSDLVVEIVLSRPFRMRRGEAEPKR